MLKNYCLFLSLMSLCVILSNLVIYPLGEQVYATNKLVSFNNETQMLMFKNEYGDFKMPLHKNEEFGNKLKLNKIVADSIETVTLYNWATNENTYTNLDKVSKLTDAQKNIAKNYFLSSFLSAIAIICMLVTFVIFIWGILDIIFKR